MTIMTNLRYKCLAIGGVPATGKTTLVKFMYPEFKTNFEYGLVKGHFNEKYNICLLGLYHTDSKFCGTDRLSMGVNKQFVQYAKQSKDKRNIIFEGDRLFSLNNLILLKDLYELKIVILQLPEEQLKQRHIDRKDTQTDKFIKGRTTKIQNITNYFKDSIETYTLTNLQESEKLSKTLLNWIKS